MTQEGVSHHEEKGEWHCIREGERERISGVRWGKRLWKMGEWLGRGNKGCMRLKRGKRTSVSGEAAEHDCWGLETGRDRERGKGTRETGQKSHHPTAYLLFFFKSSHDFQFINQLWNLSMCTAWLSGSLKSGETGAEHQPIPFRKADHSCLMFKKKKMDRSVWLWAGIRQLQTIRWFMCQHECEISSQEISQIFLCLMTHGLKTQKEMSKKATGKNAMVSNDTKSTIQTFLWNKPTPTWRL